mgnify:CR=1 FL=1
MDMLDDEAREQYQELQREVQEDDTYTVSDAEWADVVSGSLTDERLNLDKKNRRRYHRVRLGGHMERTAARVPKFWAATLPTSCTPNATTRSGTETATISGGA